MNIDNDYDNDGNNIVPCPICMSNYCPSKENAKCPGEDMFALEGEIRMLLGEYEETGDNSRIANVLETVERLLSSHTTYWKERVENEQRKYNELLLAVGNKYEGVAVVCKKEYPKLGLEEGDYFPTGNYTDEAIDKAISEGKLEIEDNK